MRAARAFTLIEVLIFIVVSGLMITTITYTFQNMLSGPASASHLSLAAELAQARMELILGQKRNGGFASFTDPCVGGSPAAACNLPVGYVATATIQNNWAGDTNYKVITVTISGKGQAQLQSMVGRYA